MKFKEYLEQFKGKRLVKTIVFSSLTLILSIFILVNAGLDGSKSSWFSDFVSTIISNIVNTVTPEASVPTIDVTGISLSLPDTAGNKRPGYEPNEIPFGGTKQLKATIEPNNATNKGIIFTCSDPDVHLTQSGTSVYVEIDKVGPEYEIVATSQFNNEIKATYTFACVDLVAPANFEIQDTNVTIDKGLTKTLNIKNITDGITYDILADRYYDDKQLVYTVDDSSIIGVEDNDVLRGLSSGTTTVHVSNGTLTKDIDVTVTDSGAPIVGISSMNITSTKDVAYLGDVDYDGPSYKEEGLHNTPLSIDWGENVPSDTGVTYTSSDPLVALVNKSGIVRGYRKQGTTTIRATSNYDSTIYAEKVIEVQPVIATSINLKSNPTELENGQKADISIEVLPINTTNKSFTVTSSNTEVLTVNNFGSSIRIIATGAGAATYTVKSNSNPSLEVTRRVVVNPKNVINDDNKEEFFKFLRKSVGHFSLFLVTGLFGTLSAYYLCLFDLKKKREWFVHVSSIFYGFMIAGFSELIQNFTKGRSALWADVGIDTLGYAIGSLFIFIFFVIYRAIKKAKDKKKEKVS